MNKNKLYEELKKIYKMPKLSSNGCTTNSMKALFFNEDDEYFIPAKSVVVPSYNVSNK